VSKEDYFHLEPLLNTIGKSKYTSALKAASVLLSIRVVGIQDQTLQQRLLQRIQDNGEWKVANLTSGQLALITMALGACHSHDENFIHDHHLISQLENKFQAEIENMEAHHDSPLTSYYQLSLDVLALCLFNGSYSATKVAEIFSPENKNFYLHGQFSVGTGAMAVLALTCVKRNLTNAQSKAGEKDLERISNHTKSLVKKILSQKKENGLLGNAFSTGNAMQALFVSSDYYQESEWNCRQTLDTVLNEISRGTFSIPIAAAQILPAVMGKTYSDVNSCVSLSFTMVESEWGPYITSVQGLKANSNDRTYWELLSEGEPLSQGAGSYVVHEGENLQVRWSTY
uniref:Transcobalamin 1 n=1 Tax=Propithecus coquereli TaxID=379532 RepID=A0A2K6GKB9_PROCO